MIHAQRTIRIGSIIIVLLVVAILLTRNFITRAIFRHESAKIKSRFGIVVKADDLKVTGISTLNLHNLQLKGTDTLFTMGNVTIRLNPFYLATLKINPKQVDISNAEVKVNSILHYIKQEHTAIKPAKQFETMDSGNNSLYHWVKAFFGLSTATFNIDNFKLSYSDSSYSGSINITNWSYKSNSFTSTVNLTDGNSHSWVKVTGTTSKRNNSVNATIQSIKANSFIPFTLPILGIKSSFNKINLKILATLIEPGKIELQLSSFVHSLWIDGKRIAQTPVVVDSCGVNLFVKVLPNSYLIDSTSTLNFNNFKGNLGLEYNPNPHRRVYFSIKTGEDQWQSLIDALPTNLFTNLSGIRVNGTFNYSLQVDVPLATPDSLTITPNLKTKGFYIKKYGNTNLAMIGDTFTHRIYIDNIHVRDIKINPQSPNYNTLGQISPYLQWAVITSEDGGFYYHRGFSLEGITYAMACNLREGRFVRGGSTITQQLIKNVFLNQNKNIGRKAEEFIITWIIENTGVVSKERILEVYLNIIEWGPNVYGICEASQYYFGKIPANLSLPEALFLAYIIPRPTKFRYLFDTEGNLKPFVTDNFTFVANKMLLHGNITQQDYDNLLTSPQVILLGPAKEILKKEPLPSENFENDLNINDMEMETK